MLRDIDVSKILQFKNLPLGKDIVNEGMEIGKDITIGTTLFMEENNVSSEAEFKIKMKKMKEIMTHMHYGLNTWEETVKGLKYIYNETRKQGFTIHRYGLTLNCVMGLPLELREKAPKSSGPILKSEREWSQLGRIVPIQPHLGDHMIGSPASLTNTVLALKAGVTTIGNISQYFTFEYAYYRDDVKRTIETLKALGVMAQSKHRGILVHSYLDDGYGGRFTDYASIAGWAMIEKYIVEKLIGAKLTHCFGGLTSNPEMRIAWVLVLDDIHERECIGSMYYGNTIDMTEDIRRNLIISAMCTLYDMAAQLKNPTGHALMPVPATEAIRIPTPSEILEIHVAVNNLKEEAYRLMELINWDNIAKQAREIVKIGKIFYSNVLNGLKELEVNVNDPLEMLLALRRIGAEKIEELWGVGQKDPTYPRGRKPVFPTDTLKLMLKHKEVVREKLIKRMKHLDYNILKGLKAIVASTDVHEYALFIIDSVLREVGVNIVNLGPSIEEAENLVQIASTVEHDVIIVTTHNAKALEYAEDLMKSMKSYSLKTPIIMGGKLHQNIGGDVPVDVSENIRNLGITTCNDVSEILNILVNIVKKKT